jgi:hypothetical protein
MKKGFFVAILVTALLSLSLLVSTAEAAKRPLLMDNKKSLFQRMLAKPGATLYAQAGGKVSGSPAPFTVYYVYARKAAEGKDWLQVGIDSHGTIKGWMPAADLVIWNQGLTVAFRKPDKTDRVLLFRDRQSLKSLVNESTTDKYQQIYQSAVKGELADNSPVVAIQPKTHVDILKDFYLVPIRDHEDVFLGSEQATMLQVSTVPLGTSEPSGTANDPKRAAPPASANPVSANTGSLAPTEGLKAGLVFVIDTTRSMGPFIDRTRKAVRDIYQKLAEANQENSVSFGLVTFRDSPNAAEGLDYLAETVASLDDGRTAEGFFNKVASVKAATVSSAGFVEDSFAGLKEAVENIDWKGIDTRYVVLITDAGARGPNDPLSSTGLNTSEMRELAHEKGIAISALHLLTPEGINNHKNAERQYRELSNYAGIGDLYYGVKMGEVGEFGRALNAMTRQITRQVQLAAGRTQGKKVTTGNAQSNSTTDDSLAGFEGKLEKLGYALRMQYLQKNKSDNLPSIFDAWLLDRDFIHPERPTLDVRVLLTRNQLSDLHDVMKQVLDTFEEGLISPRNFLADLQSLAATMSRDPEALSDVTRTTGSGNLNDMGFMQEYIEDLPYRSDVMNLSIEDWETWPAARQLEFVHGLEERIAYYRALHDHPDQWISLDGGSVGGHSVFPLELEMLP